MKLSDIKELVNLLEKRGITDDFNLTFNWFNEGHCVDLILDKVNNQLFDVGHSDKKVNIFIEEIV